VTAHPKPGNIETSTPVAGQKVVNLALQGVGSHGAFTWGVLDRLLDEERLAFDGISATSTGAVNAVVLAYGLAIGGRRAAKEALSRYWRRLAAIATVSIVQPSLLDKMHRKFGLDYSPGYQFLDMLSQFCSPYLLNPLNYNPLRALLDEIVDFELVRRQSAVKLFLCATNVRNGKMNIFNSEELRSEHVLASSCLPLTMRPVEIDNEYYWDGAFMGNPPIFPVIYECDARDIIIVHLTPSERPDNPATPRTILDRMQEITFNSTFMREMRVVAFVTQLVDDGKLAGTKRMLLHAIEGDDVIGKLSKSNTMNSDWDFLVHLHRIGRERTDDWLRANFDRLGVESTIDLHSKYL